MALSLLAALLVGCASTEPAGVKEYREITAQGLKAVQASLHSLDQISAETGSCSPKTLALFSSDVQRLQVDSIRIRSRARAIIARGDAYFKDWSENVARIKNSRVRELTEQHRPQLEESFSKIKLASKEAGSAFDTFMSGLRTLRVQLETGPDGAKSSGDLIARTRESGQEVVQQLNAVTAELLAVKAMLKP